MTDAERESEIAALRMDVEKAEAQRDALRATLARVEALAERWAKAGEYGAHALLAALEPPK